MDLRNVTYVLFITLFSFLLNGCADLDVDNENEPDTVRVLSEMDQVMALAGSSFRTIHNEIQEYWGLALPLGVMADHLTCPWGITRDYSWEPREIIGSYNNSDHYSYYFQLQGQWTESYQAVSNASSVLKWLYNEADNESENKEQLALLEAFSLFASGVSHGYLGLIFDQAVIVRYDSDYANPMLQPWDEVIDASLEMLDSAIKISDTHNFGVPPEWMGGQEMTSVELSQLASAYAARILAYSPRTRAQNSMLDWNRVLEYARNGIIRDFAPVLGDAYDWYDFYTIYATYTGWARVDMRIINLMDHDYPSRWPRDNVSWNTPDGLDPGEAEPDDARLLTDFEYLATNNFPPDRGYYHFSHYRYCRYDYLRENVWYGVGPKPSFLAWEVRLLEAEAQWRLGNKGAALAILNDPSGPRKSRGGVPDVTEEDDILRYILDEKEIECFCSGADVSYFDMRRTDRLQRGTWLQFPVPATELKRMDLAHYTINAVPDGVEGSAGDWTGWDE